MQWEIVIAVVITLLAVQLVKRLAFVSAKDAARYLQEQALIVDVRTPEEYARGHIPGALNAPLPALPNALAQHVDKDRILLLHCLSGGRSAVAQRLLRAKGYSRVHNLGGYRRAERIAAARSAVGPPPGHTDA